MYKTLREYTELSQPFSEGIFKGLREQDDIYQCIEDVCKALETIKNIKYLGKEIEEKEHKIPFLASPSYLTLRGTRCNLVTFKFEITLGEEKEVVEMPLLVHKRIDDYFYIVNGAKYYPIYQIVDESTYNTRDGIILKSLLMPIILKVEKATYSTTKDQEISANIYIANLFNKKINLLYYFLAKIGYSKTIKFLGLEKDLALVKYDKPRKGYVYFSINKANAFRVSRERFKVDAMFRSLVFMFLDVFKNKKNIIENRGNKEFWVKKLGQFFTTTGDPVEKGTTVLSSFERLLDERTKSVLRIPENDKKTIYHLFRWEVREFKKLKRKDNLSLDNKRLRLSEYLISPLLRKLSTNTYRILNTKTPLTMNRLKTIFNLSPFFLVKKQSDLLRYDNAVNDLDFNLALKYSSRGPQSLGGGGKKNVATVYRDIHLSQVGKMSLNSCSATDPGLSGTLSPFIETDGFYFKPLDDKE